YGSVPRPECRDTAACTNGQWVATPASCEPAFPTKSCPAEASHGGECATAQERCAAPGQECICLSIGSSVWICELPHYQPECPQVLPNAGTACSGTLSCRYGMCQLWANS